MNGNNFNVNFSHFKAEENCPLRVVYYEQTTQGPNVFQENELATKGNNSNLWVSLADAIHKSLLEAQDIVSHFDASFITAASSVEVCNG